MHRQNIKTFQLHSSGLRGKKLHFLKTFQIHFFLINSIFDFEKYYGISRFINPGYTSVLLDGKFELAIIAIIFAALIDGLDGRIARLIKGTSKVGKELDSLTDFVSFGIAPAFILYFWELNNYGKLGWNF